MINGVLTERTVKEVVPILETNSEGLKKALEELVKQYKSKQDEMEKWKVCGILCFNLGYCIGSLLPDENGQLTLPLQKKNNIQVVQQPGQ
jgi:prefoldin subunit 2